MTTLLPSEKARLARRKLGGSRRVELPGKLKGTRIAFGVDPLHGSFFQYFLPSSKTAAIDEANLSKVEVVPLLKAYGKTSAELKQASEAFTLGLDPFEYGSRSFRAHRSNSYVTDVVLDSFRAEQEADASEAMEDKTSRSNSYVTDVVLESVESGDEALMEKVAPEKVARRQRITWASELEAEKQEAKAEAEEQQAEADRAKADADRIRGASESPLEKAAAGGLYGYTKGTQRDVEASVRKAQRRALKLARSLYAKDERSAPFLQTHAKRSGSKTARLLLSAMKALGPKVASARVASEGRVAGGLYGHPTKTARLSLSACSDLRAHIGEIAYGLHSRRTAKYGKITGFLKEHGKTAKCGYSRMILSCYPDAPAPKMASTSRTASLAWWLQGNRPGTGVVVGTDDRGRSWWVQVGEAGKGEGITDPQVDEYRLNPEEVYDVVEKHSNNEDALFALTDIVERDFDMLNDRSFGWTKMAATPSAVVNAIQSGAAAIRSEAEAMEEDEACEMLKKAFVPDSVDSWLEWADGTRTATRRRG